MTEWTGVFNLKESRVSHTLCNHLKGSCSQERGHPLLPGNKQQNKKKWPQVVPEDVQAGDQKEFLH